MRILFLTQIIPYSQDAGPKVKTQHVLRNLVDRGHEVIFASFVRSEEQVHVKTLQNLCDEVHSVPIKRSRMMMLSFHAELRNYAVIGTANKNEHAQGFFVKYGEGGVDIQPITHLFKTRMYQLAEYLDIPIVIQERTPTTDTYSAHCTQQEFFFRLPFETMDLLWYAQEQNMATSDVQREWD